MGSFDDGTRDSGLYGRMSEKLSYRLVNSDRVVQKDARRAISLVKIGKLDESGNALAVTLKIVFAENLPMVFA
jgi:hypothetical protein